MMGVMSLAFLPAVVSTDQCVYNLKQGTCFGGRTITKMKKASVDECCNACEANKDCTHFTYTYNPGDCGLKKGIPVADGKHDHCTSGVMRGPGSECKHVHTEINKRYDSPAASFVVHAQNDPVCTLDDCGCKCRQGCETQLFTHWSLNREYDPTRKSWMCYCYAGTPTTLAKADHGWYSGVTRIAGAQNYTFPRDDDSDGTIDLVNDCVETAEACITAEEDPAGCAEKILETIVDVVKEIINAFTHSRTIDVSIPLPSGTSTFKHISQLEGDTAGEGGTDMAFGQNKDRMHMKFHNDGPLGGCQQFQHTNCDWGLIVCVSNPLIGCNKARVAYGPSSELDEQSVWDALDDWGQVHTTDSVSLSDKWNRYDNPSTIQYTLNVPEQCKTTSMLEV